MKAIPVILAALLAVSARAALEFGPASADTNATRTTVDVLWSLAGTNTTSPTVTLYWAAADMGTNAGSWSYSTNVGARAVASYTNRVGALTPSRPWYFRLSAVDDSNTVWSTNYAYSMTLSGAPTSPAPSHAYVPIMVGTNGVIAAPTGIVDFVTSGGVSLTNTDAIARRTITNQIATTDANMVWDVSGRIPVVTDESSDARYFVATQDAPGAPLQQLSPADARALMELGTAGTANLAGATWAQGEVPQAGTNTITYSGLVVYDADSGHVRMGTIDDAASMRGSLELSSYVIPTSGVARALAPGATGDAGSLTNAARGATMIPVYGAAAGYYTIDGIDFGGWVLASNTAYAALRAINSMNSASGSVNRITMDWVCHQADTNRVFYDTFGGTPKPLTNAPHLVSASGAWLWIRHRFLFTNTASRTYNMSASNSTSTWHVYVSGLFAEEVK